MDAVWADLVHLMEAGGFVMPPLFAATVVLWYAMGLRWMAFRGAVREGTARAAQVARRVPPEARDAHLGPVIEEALGPVVARLSRGRALVRSIVTVAPLAGLLGTVAGMIETFDALGDSALFAQTGGIAGGISQALLTTQMGLVVAVPGVVVGRLLDRRQARLEDDLARVKQRTLNDAGVRVEEGHA